MPARETSSVPHGTCVYAIGDIHGELGPLARLVAMVRRDASHAGAERRALVFLGDYVDRGLQSREVIEFLLDDPAPGFETVFLKGNHEAWVLAFLDDAGVGRQWLAAGGQGTLLSYGVSLPPGPRNADCLEALRASFAEAFPDAHRAFLNGLATLHVEGGYAFVHAGVRPGTPLKAQREEDLLWGVDGFVENPGDHGKIVVHGHSFAPEPVVARNRIGIDTGAYATGRLTCLVLEGTSRRFLST